MTLDPEIARTNRAATDRIRALANGRTEGQLLVRVGEHWTVAVTLAHLAFWDRRVTDILERAETAGPDGALEVPTIDVVANDLLLPTWLALPPSEAARLAVEAAEALDARLEAAPDAVVGRVGAINERWVRRHLHRNEHLDEATGALDHAVR